MEVSSVSWENGGFSKLKAGVETVKADILNRWLPLCTFDEVFVFLFNELHFIEEGLGYGSKFSLKDLFLSFEFPAEEFLYFASCLVGKSYDCDTGLVDLLVEVKLVFGELVPAVDFGPGLVLWFFICKEAATGEEKFPFKDVGLGPGLFLGIVYDCATGLGNLPVGE